MLGTMVLFAFLAVAVWALAQSVWIFLQSMCADMGDGKTGSIQLSSSDLVSHPSLRIAVLIPAHNEEQGIAKTLLSVMADLHANDLVFVVADNCSDQTARISKEQGAIVIERVDSHLRGKGFALQAGVDAIMSRSACGQINVDAVLFLDADCTVRPGCVPLLKTAMCQYDVPVQSLDLMHDDVGVEMSAGLPRRALSLRVFAWQFKNWVRPAGSARMGSPCPLMGTGMMMPLGLLKKVRLAGAELAEDALLGIRLAEMGVYPRFVPSAVVDSIFPEANVNEESQARRWIHGHLANQLRLPKLFLSGVRYGRIPALLFFLDSLVLPMVMLLAINLMLLVVGGLLLPWFGSLLAFVACASLAFQCLALTMASKKLDARVVSLRNLGKIGKFAFARLKVATQFLARREKQWIRTKR